MRAFHYLSLCVLLCVAVVAQDTSKIFVVRHAEKESDADQSLLSAQGHARAECLAQTLRDASIRTVLATQYERTQQTAAPLVSATKAKQLTFNNKAYEQIIATAKTAAQSGNVLIVGHSNTIPTLMSTFHTPSVTIPSDAFDQLFVFDAASPQRLTVLHYCPNLPRQQSGNSMMKP